MKTEKTEKSEKVLLLLSGGRDSFLSACRLIESGYEVVMVTYDNGCSFQSNRAREVADRLLEVYGENKVKYLGVYSIVGYNLEFYPKFLNMKPSDILNNYGEITGSQFNCLVCRTNMYLYSINICRKFGITKIAEGAREVQGFVIELREMMERYKRLLKEYNIDLILPVYDLESDWKRKIELFKRGFLPKTCESQCVLGVPLDGSVDEEVIKGVLNYYDKEIEPLSKSIIKENENLVCVQNHELI